MSRTLRTVLVAKRWRDLSAKDRRRALDLIRGEMFMWRHGRSTNWEPGSLPEVKRNYHVLKLALRELSTERR